MVNTERVDCLWKKDLFLPPEFGQKKKKKKGHEDCKKKDEDNF